MPDEIAVDLVVATFFLRSCAFVLAVEENIGARGSDAGTC